MALSSKGTSNCDLDTRVFAQQFPVLTEEGPDREDPRVADYMWAARERGVHFDLGHGGGSFWFRNAVPAIQQGWPPDSISTDLHMGSVNAAVLNTLRTASKCLAMGMPLPEVVYRCTVTPAKAIRRPHLGTLSVGAEADVAVLRHLLAASASARLQPGNDQETWAEERRSV